MRNIPNTQIEQSPSPEPHASEDLDRAESRNFRALAGYQIVMRVGWIFKTESIIIPAFLDAITPAGGLQSVLRGILPVLNRFGHSVPPVLFARRLKVTPRKKWALVLTTVSMSAVFLALSVMWFSYGSTHAGWLPWAFLLFYGLFFIATGMNHLALNTLQGKLIQAKRRGRLMAVATTIGCPAAILAAYLFMGRWLSMPEVGFGYIFGFSGVAFLLATLCILFLHEPSDHYDEPAVRPLSHFRDVITLLRVDRNLRQVAVVASLFSTTLILFPHYQAMARERLQLPLDSLLLWVTVQNAGTGIFMMLAGPTADRRGNRIVLRLALLASALTPLLAIVLAELGPQNGAMFYWLVFFLIGVTPVALKTLTNYTLEICEPSSHPRYVSTVSLCLALPIILFSPIIGWLVGLVGFETVFALGAALILLACLFTFRLVEPRHHVDFPTSGVAVTAEE